LREQFNEVWVPAAVAEGLHARTRIWAELHERAFRRLGGAPRVLGEGVLRPDIPAMNPLG